MRTVARGGMMMVCRRAAFTMRADDHPHGDAGDDRSGGDLKIRLRRLGFERLAELQRKGRENPNHRRMRDRRADCEQRRLGDRATDRDDKRRHHSL